MQKNTWTTKLPEQIAWLDEDSVKFPNPESALAEPNGLLAAGGDLSVSRLIEAYRSGIFPWYDEDQPILWWSPDPRCVIAPSTFTPKRSLRRSMAKAKPSFRIDSRFTDVLSACQVRHDASGTWITEEMANAYVALHEAGFAHSVECYIDDELAGGLYGVAIGPFFFGESMFHRKTDASKMAFSHLMDVMKSVGCPLVDCQLTNPHLSSLGAVEIPRKQFLQTLRSGIDEPHIPWTELAS